nr:hypothetical protein [uncultured Rhodopila sp.]
MTRRHTIETERIAADDDGEFIAALLAIKFNYTAPGLSGGTWNRAMGGYDPPDDEEIEFHAASVLIDHRWIGIPWQAPLSEWAAKWLDEHHDEAREAAGEDDDAAREARAEARRDE